MTNDVNDGAVENIQRIAFVSTAGVAFGMPTINGKIRTAETPYGYDVAEGNITNHQSFFRMGYVGALGKTSGDMWALGNTVPTIPKLASSGQSIAIAVTSTLDCSSNGTGIKTVVVDYLDTSYTARTTTLTLSTAAATGIGAESSAINAMVINSIRAATCGTLGKAAGTVSVCASSASTQIYRQIQAGETRGRTAVYTVPLGQTLYITNLNAGVGVGGAGSWVRAKLQATVQNDGTVTDFYMPLWENIVGVNGQVDLQMPIKIPATATVKMVGVTNQSSGMSVECEMRGWIES